MKDGALTNMFAHAAEHAQNDAQSPVAVVFISAFYYVAIAAGLIGTSTCTSTSQLDFGADEVCDALAKLMYDTKSSAKDAANAARLHEILHRIFGMPYLGQVCLACHGAWLACPSRMSSLSHGLDVRDKGALQACVQEETYWDQVRIACHGTYLGQVRCFFARDWELNEGAVFRTTWTAGWWPRYYHPATLLT